MNISIIIPAYNEEAAIGEAIRRVADFFSTQGGDFEIIVVDDGSSDRTSVAVREHMARYGTLRLITNETNRGKGFSVRRGALAARGDLLLFLDADLSTAPEEFEKFKPALRDHDIVIGSRALPSSVITVHQPLPRELAGRTFNKIIRWYLGLPWRDTQCGFKCFRRETRHLFNLQTQDRWVFDVELLVLAKKLGFRVAEAPIVWRNDPTSTVRPIDLLRTLRELRHIKKKWQAARAD